MRTFVVTIEDSLFNPDPSIIFSGVKGIQTIEETTKSKLDHLSLPGQALSAEEIELLANEMEQDILNKSQFLSLEQLKSDLESQFQASFKK